MARDHLFRSRKQHPFRTCNLSVDVPDFEVPVHGRPWSSATVDVPTDVDRAGGFRSGVCRLPIHLILDQVLLHQPWHSDHASCMGGIPSAWRSPTTRCPGGNVPPHRRAGLPCLSPGDRVVALKEVDGMPHSLPAGLDARISHPEACRGVGDERRRWFPGKTWYPAQPGHQPAN